VATLERQRINAQALELLLQHDPPLPLWKRRKVQSMLRLLRQAIAKNEEWAKFEASQGENTG
jgi:hypothetical protein